MIEAGAEATFVEAPVSEFERARITRELATPPIANTVFRVLTPEIGQAELAGLAYGVVLCAVT